MQGCSAANVSQSIIESYLNYVPEPGDNYKPRLGHMQLIIFTSPKILDVIHNITQNYKASEYQVKENEWFV